MISTKLKRVYHLAVSSFVFMSLIMFGFIKHYVISDGPKTISLLAINRLHKTEGYEYTEPIYHRNILSSVSDDSLGPTDVEKVNSIGDYQRKLTEARRHSINEHELSSISKSTLLSKRLSKIVVNISIYFNISDIGWDDDNHNHTEQNTANYYSDAVAINVTSIKSRSVYQKNRSVKSGSIPSSTDAGLNKEDIDDLECRSFHSDNVSDVCKYVNETDDCHSDDGFINYIAWIYCTMSDLIPLAMVTLFVWWLFLFIGLAVTADDFFCPALGVISKTMHLSHNIAGVTFLAFGNGAPDIFSAISAINSSRNGDVGLAFGALFGAGIFVTTIVAGTISFIKPFHIMTRPFLRDVIFYIAAAYWTFYIMWDHVITKFEAIGFILLYVVYVLVVVIGRYIRQKFSHKTLSIQAITPDMPVDIEDYHKSRGYMNFSEDDDDLIPCPPPDPRARTLLDVARYGSFERTISTDESVLESSLNEETAVSPLADFLHAIQPISIDKWREQRFYTKIYDIIKAPIMFVLILTIPLVDYEQERRNWQRHLNSLHCITGPLFAVFATNVAFYKIGGVFPVYALVLLIGFVLCLLVFFTSQYSQPPVYQACFAYLGFVVAVIWIYIIANEIVNLLKTFGTVFNIANAVLGLTLLAWGNSVGDLITDTIMARQGYPRVGISACFGGPLFNLLLGIGIPFTLKTIKMGGHVKLSISLEEVVLVSFLLGSLISTLIIVPACKFKMTRAYGVYLWLFYLAFLTVAILTSRGVIHTDYFL